MDLQDVVMDEACYNGHDEQLQPKTDTDEIESIPHKGYISHNSSVTGSTFSPPPEETTSTEFSRSDASYSNSLGSNSSAANGTPISDPRDCDTSSGDQSGGMAQGGVGARLGKAELMASKYANNLNGWLEEVARVKSGGETRQVEIKGGGSFGLLPKSGEKWQREVSFDSSSGIKFDPIFYNAIASYQEIREAGPATQPAQFPEAIYSKVMRVNASVYNPETDEELVVPNVLYEVRADGHPPERAYWVGRKLQKAIFGCVCACSVLKVRDGGWAGVNGNSLWELTPELAAVKVIDIATVQQCQWKHIEDPLKEVAAMQYCARNGEEPNLLTCWDVYKDETYVYMFMPYCSRGELFSCVQRNGRFEESIAKYWFKQLLSGLISLQKNGICHRDISLENILINENTHALVIDLGMCLRVPFKKSQEPNTVYGTMSDTLRLLISPQQRCGKPNYTSPEIVNNDSSFDGFAVDIWAMGIILFTMLVGIPPFETASKDDSRYKLVCAGGLEKLIYSWNRPISPLAIDLLQSMLREDPQDRLSLFQIMNHAWVLEESPISWEVISKVSPDDDDSDGTISMDEC